MNNRIRIFLNFLLKNNKLRSFLLFFTISTVLWLSSQMSKNYQYTFKVPVVYSNLPPRYYKGFLPNDTLQITVQMSGYQLLKNKISKHQFYLDVQKNKLINTESWVPKKFHNQISNLFGSQIKILNISPESLSFKMKSVNKKHLPVRPDIELTYLPGFKNKRHPKIKPDSIWVYGENEILDTLHFVKTRHYVISNIKNNINKTLMLKKIDGLKFNKNKVQLIIPVSEIVEKTISLPVDIKGAPKAETILLFPKKIKLNFKYFKNEYKNFNTNDFRVEVFYNPKKKLWFPKLSKKPSYAFGFVFQPDTITYLIKQK